MATRELFDMLSGNGSDFGIVSNPQIEELLRKQKEDQSRMMAEQRAQDGRFDLGKQIELEDEPGNNVFNSALLGMLRRGADEKAESFEEFADRKTPALSFLGDIARGWSASKLGTKFVSTRERLMDEYKVEQDAKLKRQELESRNMQTALQIAGQLKAVGAREEGATLRHRERLEFDNSSAERRFELAGQRLGLEGERIDLAKESHELAIKRFGLDEAEAAKSPIGFLEVARQALLPTLIENAQKDGIDTGSPEFALSSFNAIKAYGMHFEKELSEARRDPNKGKSALGGLGTPRLVKDNTGRDMFVTFDKAGHAYRVTMDPNQPIEPLRPGQVGGNADFVKNLREQRDAARLMNQVVETFYANPDVVGLGVTVNRMVSGDAVQNMLSLAEKMGANEYFPEAFDRFKRQKDFAAQLDLVTAMQTRAFTGAQMTDKERGFIRRTLPSGASESETVSLLASRAAIMRMLEIRSRLGLRVGQTDSDIGFDEVISAVTEQASAYGVAVNKKLKDLTKKEVESFLGGREGLVSSNPEARLVSVAKFRPNVKDMFATAARLSGRPEVIEEVERLLEMGEI